MDKSLFLFLFFFILACCFDINHALKVCSYSGMSCNRVRSDCPRAGQAMLKIITRCDIILLITKKPPSDRDMNRASKLVRLLNRFGNFIIYKIYILTKPVLLELINWSISPRKFPENTYNYIKSEEMMKRSWRRVFAFIYRSDLVEMKYDSTKKGPKSRDYAIFHPESFYVRFHANNTSIKDFTLIPIWTNPEEVKKESRKLSAMFQAVQSKWENKMNAMFLGDFSALAHPKEDKSLNKFDQFLWLIDEKMDTMVKEDINSANDRFVVFGSALQKAIVAGSAKPLNTQTEYSLSEKEALCFSEHYPIEVDLKEIPTKLVAPKIVGKSLFDAIAEST